MPNLHRVFFGQPSRDKAASLAPSSIDDLEHLTQQLSDDLEPRF